MMPRVSYILKKSGKIGKCGTHPGFMVFLLNTYWYVLADNRNFGAPRNFIQIPSHDHGSSKSRSLRFKNDPLHNPLARNKFEKFTLRNVHVIRGFACLMIRIQVGKRHPINAAFPCVERIYSAFHSFWWKPCNELLRIHKCPVECVRWCHNNSRCGVRSFRPVIHLNHSSYFSYCHKNNEIPKQLQLFATIGSTIVAPLSFSIWKRLHLSLEPYFILWQNSSLHNIVLNNIHLAISFT